VGTDYSRADLGIRGLERLGFTDHRGGVDDGAERAGAFEPPLSIDLGFRVRSRGATLPRIFWDWFNAFSKSCSAFRSFSLVVVWTGAPCSVGNMLGLMGGIDLWRFGLLGVLGIGLEFIS
jgi:hypothetical protein